MKRVPIALAAAVACLAAPAAAQQAAPCTDVDGFHRLDFWLGSWDVYAGGQQVGTNHIEAVLDGCAVTERWRSAAGGEGRSLFYFTPATGAWKQVWVTGSATAPGGVKEKTLVAEHDDGGVVFQGEIPLPGGSSYLDRTTLTPLPDGTVRQHIEISTDGGTTWRTTFDAVYRPAR